MQFLYYLLIFLVAVSAIIAILIATGILHIEIHKTEDYDDLPDDVRKMLDEKDKENERS